MKIIVNNRTDAWKTVKIKLLNYFALTTLHVCFRNTLTKRQFLSNQQQNQNQSLQHVSATCNRFEFWLIRYTFLWTLWLNDVILGSLPNNDDDSNGNVTKQTGGPFLERPATLTSPESDFDIKVPRKVGRVLTSNEVHFVSLADTFTVQFSNLLKIPLDGKQNSLTAPVIPRELRETGPRVRRGLFESQLTLTQG